MKNILLIALAVIFAVTGIILLNLDPPNRTQAKVNTPQPLEITKPAPDKPVLKLITPENASAAIKPDGVFDISKITQDPKEIAIIEEYMTDIDLQDSVRSYFDSYENLSDTERSKLAGKIEAELDRQEAANKIIPLEALSLRLALLKTTTSDADYPELARALTERYQDAIAATEPQFDTERADRYKAEEQRILYEVKDMTQFPRGMTQSEYLRERLDELREEIYSDDE